MKVLRSDQKNNLEFSMHIHAHRCMWVFPSSSKAKIGGKQTFRPSEPSPRPQEGHRFDIFLGPPGDVEWIFWVLITP